MGSPIHRTPTRTCVACRAVRPKRDLVRVVRTPAGAVAFDGSGRMAGRGAYLCADGTCWATALKRHSIERALDAPLPPELRAKLESGGTANIEGGIRGT